MPLFVLGQSNIDPNLVVGLSRWMFPIIAILGMTGVVTGILNSYEIFGLPAMAPIAWNAVIVAALVLEPHSAYAYAISVLVATIVQFLIPLPLLRGREQGLVFSLAWRNPHVKRVLRLMLPVTLGLGLINFNLTLDLSVATLVPGGHADAYLNYAFRMFMLPQGLFSVAVSAVLFPRISRLAARGDMEGFARTFAAGTRTIVFLLLPAAAISIALAAADHARPLPAREVHLVGHLARGRRADRVLARPDRERHGPAAHPRVLRAPAAAHPDACGLRQPLPERDPRPGALQASGRGRDRPLDGGRHDA